MLPFPSYEDFKRNYTGVGRMATELEYATMMLAQMKAELNAAINKQAKRDENYRTLAVNRDLAIKAAIAAGMPESEAMIKYPPIVPAPSLLTPEKLATVPLAQAYLDQLSNNTGINVNPAVIENNAAKITEQAIATGTTPSDVVNTILDTGAPISNRPPIPLVPQNIPVQGEVVEEKSNLLYWLLAGAGIYYLYKRSKRGQ